MRTVYDFPKTLTLRSPGGQHINETKVLIIFQRELKMKDPFGNSDKETTNSDDDKNNDHN